LGDARLQVFAEPTEPTQLKLMFDSEATELEPDRVLVTVGLGPRLLRGRGRHSLAQRGSI
jgi:hypothetical protein